MYRIFVLIMLYCFITISSCFAYAIDGVSLGMNRNDATEVLSKAGYRLNHHGDYNGNLQLTFTGEGVINLLLIVGADDNVIKIFKFHKKDAAYFAKKSDELTQQFNGRTFCKGVQIITVVETEHKEKNHEMLQLVYNSWGTICEILFNEQIE